MDTIVSFLLCIFAGGIWGSFLGVLAVRIPSQTSIFLPGSRCDHCLTPLEARDLIPFLSWTLLGGRCRACQARILPEVFVSEVATTFFCCCLALSPLSLSGKILLFLFFSFALPLTLIDIRHHRLPHALTLPAIAVGLILSFRSFGGDGLLLSFAGAGLGFLSVALIATVYRKGVGMGDAFWLSAIGAFTGVGNLPGVLLISSGTGIAGAILLHVLYRPFREKPLFGTALPFGPFLSFGGLMVLAVPDQLHRLAEHLF